MNSAAQVSHGFFVLLTVILVVVVLRAAEEVFIPLALALLLTFLLAPVVHRLQSWGINRIVAVALTVAIAFSVIGGLAFVVFDQFTQLVEELPRYRMQLRANLADLRSAFGGNVGDTRKAVEQITEEIKRAAPSAPTSDVPRVQIVEPEMNPAEALWALLGPLVAPLGTAALVVVFVVFMLLRLADLRERFIRLLGPRNLHATTEALSDAASRVSRFLVMQTMINGGQGIAVAIGLTLIGVPNAVLWGAMTLVLRFIPYVGPWLAAAMPIALSFAVFDDWTYPLMTAAMFVVFELISNTVLEPWLYGSGTGVSSLALLVAAAFWTWLWGAVGLFLAVPLTVCLVVLGKYIPQLEFLHVILGDQPALEPHQRLYERLLVGNRDEADDLIEQYLGEHSLIEVCDQVIVPAIQLAEEAFEQDMIEPVRRQEILERMDDWAEHVAETQSAAEPGKEEEKEEEGEPTAFAGRRVLCIPASDHADEVCARLLAALLVQRGVDARAATVAGQRGGLSDLVDGVKPDVIVVSAMPPNAVARARHLCRRIRTRFPRLPIVVGLWNAHGTLAGSRERLEPAGATRVVAQFGECIDTIETLPAALPSAEPARA